MDDILDGWAARGGAASAKAQCLVFDERASGGEWRCNGGRKGGQSGCFVVIATTFGGGGRRLLWIEQRFYSGK